MEQDDLSVEDFSEYSKFHILENKSPKLCTDRLDGVLHTCYIWLHTHSLEEIKEVYDNLTVLENEYGDNEIGFRNKEIAEKFVAMVYNYAKELQGNKDKYVMKYISEMVKLSFEKKLLSLEDLYTKKEEEVCTIFSKNFLSWEKFNKASILCNSEVIPKNHYYISFETKRRNTIPLVRTIKENKRIDLISVYAKEQYEKLELYKEEGFAYIKDIEKLD